MAVASGVMRVVLALVMVVICEARGAMFSILMGSGVQGDHSAGEEAPMPVRSTVELEYHSGPMLSGIGSLDVNLIWYGSFSDSQRSTIVDFFSSFQESPDVHPSVSSWWKTTSAYKDFSNTGVKPTVKLAGEVSNTDYTLGRRLSRWDVELLVVDSLSSFTPDSKAIYLVLTSEDVYVDGFCRSSCASHSFIPPSAVSMGHQLSYAWVGNSGTQCPGMCAWPFALPAYAPLNALPLVAPNGDIGLDGMVINIANMLAGTATDPYINAYYQGDALAPLESATACAGIYGEGAYPGCPGQLLKDPIVGASYNVHGVNRRMFLLPALWDPVTRTCAPPS